MVHFLLPKRDSYQLYYYNQIVSLRSVLSTVKKLKFYTGKDAVFAEDVEKIYINED
jgi:hypothetical protein